MIKKSIIFSSAIFILTTGCTPTALGKKDDTMRASPKVIDTFEGCVEAGNPLLKTLPPKCVTPEGDTYVKGVIGAVHSQGTSGCTDNCGNGLCEEMVCLALGCPCGESNDSCPEDCH